MFNVRPDTPWIYLSPEPVDDDPPGFRLAPDGSTMDTRQLSPAFGSSAYSPGIAAIPAESAADGGHPFQEAFDQLARIYAGVGSLRRQASGFGSTAVDGRADLQGSPMVPQLGDPWSAPATSVGDSRFTMLPYADPSIQAPPRPFAGEAGPLYRMRNTEGDVLSDVVPDDGLRDGQQYAQYRPSVALGGVRIGTDPEGRDALIPDKPGEGDQSDPFEKLKQRGYPKPPDDPTNGSAMVKGLREREQYGPHQAGYHRYEFTDHLCNVGDPGCTAEAAYDALLRNAVPGGPAPGVAVVHEQESPASFKGIPGGRVRTLVDRDSSSIINQTLPDHQFHNGFVQRQIVEKNGKVYLRTFGEGNNSTPDKAAWNSLLARSAFDDSTARIRAAIRPAPPIGKQ